jgi:hypothetical protein
MTVCWLPAAQVKVCGAVSAAPSTVIANPLGDEVTEKVEFAADRAIDWFCTASCGGFPLSVAAS